MSEASFSTTRDIIRFEGADRTSYWRRFSWLLSASVIMATMGMLRDSAAVVIAAMLIAPLMTPILGIAAAMILGRGKRVASLLAIVVFAAAACSLLSFIMMYVAHVPTAMRIPEQVLLRTDPGIEDLVIALAAGATGAYVQIQKTEISLLPGAAIGVSLVPPLSAAGVLIFFGQYLGAEEAVLLFVTNLCAIILSACAVYVASGTHSVIVRKGRRRTHFIFGISTVFLSLVLVLVPLTTATFYRYSGARAEAEMTVRIKEWADPLSVELLRVAVNTRRNLAEIWAVVDLPIETKTRLAPLEDILPRKLSMQSVFDIAREVLGEEYSVSIRYQTRIAGIVDLDTQIVRDAPPVGQIMDR